MAPSRIPALVAVATCHGCVITAERVLRTVGATPLIPKFSKRMRLPRGRPIRVITKPVFPHLLFVDPEEAGLVLRVSREGWIPALTLMHKAGSDSLALVSRSSLEQCELQAQGKPLFSVGDRVEVASSAGLFQHMTGIVRSTETDYAVVDFGSLFSATKIAYCVLRPETL